MRSRPAKAEIRRKEFFPFAETYIDPLSVFKRDDIEVVDIATHPAGRHHLISAALDSGKHVLSQKPFVLDLYLGERLATKAEKKGLKLAVNHNGRWAPHFSYIRQAVAKGLLGEVFAVHLSCHWNHEWIVGTPFDGVHHIVLYDYAIHWFDILTCLMPGRVAKCVFSTLNSAPHQKARPPLLGQVVVDYDGGAGKFDV